MRTVRVSASPLRFHSPLGRDAAGMGSVRLHGEGRTVTVRIATDAGAERCCIRDDVIVVDQSRNDPGIVADIIGPALLGEDPCYHARIWQ